MIRAVGALVAVAALAGVARGEPAPAEPPERAFQAASQRAAAGALGEAIDAFEALAAARPASRWTDDAWVEAARLAERTGDYDRARRDLGEAIAHGTDAVLVRRARGDLARLAGFTGTTGEWSGVAAAHDRLVDRAAGAGDPEPALVELEALVREHPGYPRGVAARLALARAWEEAAQIERALGWLRDAVRVASPHERDAVRVTLVRTLIRQRELVDARHELAQLGDREAVRALDRELAIAHRRAWVRGALGGTLVALVIAAMLVLRRDAGSWPAAARAVVRPSSEALYFAPIGAVVAIIAATGNPLVFRAVVYLVIAGTGVAWLSGATLEAARQGRGAIGKLRAFGQAVAAAVAVLASAYLIIDHVRLLDLVAETWHHGPAPR